MSEDGRLDRIRAHAARTKTEAKHHHEKEHHHEEHEGERAAKADFSRIVEAIEKRQNAWTFRTLQIGRHVAKHGHGADTWVMPTGFRSDADGLKNPRVIGNSHAFIAAYAKTLQKELGDHFFVLVDGHEPSTQLIITWAPPPAAGGH